METITPNLLVKSDNLSFVVRGLFECRVFIACHPNDKEFEATLRSHLFPLEKKYKLKIRGKEDIPYGVDAELKTKEFVKESDILLMLLSKDFQFDDKKLFDQYWADKNENAVVVPIKAKACIPRDEIQKLLMTPSEPIGKPDNDPAFEKVVTALEKVFQNHYKPKK